jgi:hypothetical protein
VRKFQLRASVEVKMNAVRLCLLTALIATAATPRPVSASHGFPYSIVQIASAGEWQYYDLYEPEIERHCVLDADLDGRKFHHAATIEYFDGKWIALWHAAEQEFNDLKLPEGQPGQGIFMSTSSNAEEWETNGQDYIWAFSSYTRSVNPIAIGNGTQWQPGLVKVSRNDTAELWALWRQFANEKDGATEEDLENAGLYFSRLFEADGQWTNEQITGKEFKRADGWCDEAQCDTNECYISDDACEERSWNVFVAGNGAVLSTGRVIFPITLINYSKLTSNSDHKKRNAVIVTDDLGENWTVGGSAMPLDEHNWEPTVWEDALSGSLHMVARYTETNNTVFHEKMRFAVSYDGGMTWAECESDGCYFNPVQVSNTREHVVTRGKRAIMAANDWMFKKGCGEAGSERHNLALFFNTSFGFDFVAGNSLTTEDGLSDIVHYPQIAFHPDPDEDMAAVIYSIGPHDDDHKPHSIQVAKITGLPSETKNYIYPRYGHDAYFECTPDAVDNHRPVERHSVNQNHLVFENDYASAGWEVPANNPDTDELHLHFRFKVFAGSKNTLVSLGHPGMSAKVFANNGAIQLKRWVPSVETVFCGFYSDWTNIDIVTGQGVTRVSVDSGPFCEIEHTPTINTVYLGESFFNSEMEPNPGNSFRVDLNAVRAKVETGCELGAYRSCGQCALGVQVCESTGLWGSCESDGPGECEPGAYQSCGECSLGVQGCGVSCNWGSCEGGDEC